MKKTTRIILSVVVGTLLTGLAYYLILPALNPQSVGFWVFLVAVVLFYAVPLGMFSSSLIFPGRKNSPKKVGLTTVGKVTIGIVAALVTVMLVGSVISSSMFNAERYASVITVENAVFSEDMPEADTVTNISLMDTDSAIILGNRELGALSDVVSQYSLSTDYNQINYKGTPKKVANLEYVDFFRWVNNVEKGIPGYVMVDPVNSSAEYIKFEKPLRYVQSGYFGDDLMRKLRFEYPTKIFSTVNFEIDEEGNPWFIVSCMKPRVGLFGAMDVSEVIIFNPCDGTSSIHALDKTPSWIDNVFDGYLASEKYDWYGTLSGGFINSVIGQQDCKQTTADFGYIVLGDDVWYFTGVTSVTGDESNIGFIISNARTGEYKYYPVIGAEEYSAMGAAQGEVQEKGYVASFPSLINVEGQATYIMVLKDANGLVKLYALVNVENYSIVATGETQAAAKEAYLQTLIERDIIQDKVEDAPVIETKTATVTVLDVRLATVGGETVVYLTADDGNVYKGSLSDDETMILISAGQSLLVEYEETSHKKIRSIVAWSEAPLDDEA
jgi:hypothetical protein